MHVPPAPPRATDDPPPRWYSPATVRHSRCLRLRLEVLGMEGR